MEKLEWVLIVSLEMQTRERSNRKRVTLISMHKNACLSFERVFVLIQALFINTSHLKVGRNKLTLLEGRWYARMTCIMIAEVGAKDRS